MKHATSLLIVPLAALAAGASACASPERHLYIDYPIEGALYVWHGGLTPGELGADLDAPCTTPSVGHQRLATLAAAHNVGAPTAVELLYITSLRPLLVASGAVRERDEELLSGGPLGQVFELLEINGQVRRDGAELTMFFTKYDLPAQVLASSEEGTDGEPLVKVSEDPRLPREQWQRVEPTLPKHAIYRVSTRPDGSGTMTTLRSDGSVLAEASWSLAAGRLRIDRQLSGTALQAVTTVDPGAAVTTIDLSDGDTVARAEVFTGVSLETVRLEADGNTSCWKNYGDIACDEGCP